MVFAYKRSLFFLSVASIFLLLVFYFREVILPAGPRSANRPSTTSTCPLHPPATTYARTKNASHFDWSTITTHHPLENLTSLPAEQPLSLRRVQHTFRQRSRDTLASRSREYRRNEVKKVFEKGWRSYRERAWLKDELAPVTGGSKTTFGGWAATLVDNLDSLLIMGMMDDFEEAVVAAAGIDFDPESPDLGDTINVFETTIRYLGGFLSAYDLTECKDKRLLDKAVEMGEMLLATFDTPNHMPVMFWSPRKAANGEAQDATEDAVISGLGSSSLEFTRLSQLTGDMRYYTIVQNIADIFEEQQNRTRLPGMWPVNVNGRAPDLTTGNGFSLGAMADSAYEYLGKMYQLLGGVGYSPQYEKLYGVSMDAAIQWLLYRPMVPDNADILLPGIAHADNPDSPWTEPVSQHLICFVGGMLALGGRLFGLDSHVEYGRKVTEGCIWTYLNSPLGIMPEWFHMSMCPSKDHCEWNETVWASEAESNPPKGFKKIDDPRYILRPEAVESVFYMYRITGDEHFQDIAWDMFQAINNVTTTEYANSAIDDMRKEHPEKVDSMESFWLAETLKYLYLIFSDPEYINLDDFVFNTEAHPFRRPGR